MVSPGPSPRVRGSLVIVAHVVPYSGSIPACAGEPTTRCPTRRAPGVHPRVCGGAYGLDAEWSIDEGPSPRVRGSRVDYLLHAFCTGSIPACAGEPRGSCTHKRATRVHPRVCGGAAHHLRASE